MDVVVLYSEATYQLCKSSLIGRCFFCMPLFGHVLLSILSSSLGSLLPIPIIIIEHLHINPNELRCTTLQRGHEWLLQAAKRCILWILSRQYLY